MFGDQSKEYRRIVVWRAEMREKSLRPDSGEKENRPLIGIGNDDLVRFKDSDQSLKRPIVGSFGFFGHKTEGNTEGFVGAGDSRDLEQRHAVFVRFVCAVE